ncbi:hypothetical protein [Trichocoleus sp. FACHB-69]|uniref:hypothetical protein n=1 Tax=Trichocoleus sp. FACHB-69 TaxID=2692874 RepID=UPI0028C3AFAA|nr:hypothetical protein [Trichocoleus sp. FACHB-69]
MPVLSPKAFAFTNVPTASNDISPLIRWAFCFLPTARKPMSPMTKAKSEMLSHNLDYFRAKQVNILLYHHSAGQWLSSRGGDGSFARPLPPDHDQDPI